MRNFIQVSVLLATVVFCVIHSPAQQLQTSPAAVPRLVKFGGVLKDGAGQPLTDVVGVSFALYKDQHDGVPLWIETQNVQLDERGNYSAMLGSTSSEGLPLELFVSGESRWLGVQAQVPGAEEQPRVLLVSVPYALKAADAETLGGKPLSAFALAPEVVTERVMANNGLSPQAANSGTTASLGGSGSLNQVAKWIDGSGNLGNSIITDNGTNVGVGTGSPGFALHVAGNRTDFISKLDNQSFASTAHGLWLNLNSGDPASLPLKVTSGGGALTPLAITGNGNVGVGTGSPGFALHASGNRTDFISKLDNQSFASTAQGLWVNVNSGDPASLPLKVTTSGGALTPFVITGNGNVGIGTAAPTDRLDVESNAETNLLFKTTAVSASTRVKLQPTSNGLAAFEGLAGTMLFGSANDLVLATGAGPVDGYSERMRVLATGNVGIGTATPSQKLEVAGNAKIGGTLTLTGTFTANGGTLSGQLASSVATGTAPFAVASTTQVANLNASLLGGNAPSAFAPVSGSANYVSKAGDTIAGALTVTGAFNAPGITETLNGTSPNIIIGFGNNAADAFVVGATISGGGQDSAAQPPPPARVPRDVQTAASPFQKQDATPDQDQGTEDAEPEPTKTVNVKDRVRSTEGSFRKQANSVCGTPSCAANNRVTDDFGVVGGGQGNLAGNANASHTDAGYATVNGGYFNEAGYDFATVGGGGLNFALNGGSTVGGGFDNYAQGFLATVAGGRDNDAYWDYSTVGGGDLNTASDGYSTVGGGFGNTAGTGLSSTVDHRYATVGGGNTNAASGQYATVGGGGFNVASGSFSTVAGGGYSTSSFGNKATADSSTVGGGYYNWATNVFATVGGGNNHLASGFSATIPGGYSNYASGYYSFAAGTLANAIHQGAFVWADSTGSSFYSSAINEFSVRASGGTRIFSNSTSTAGVTLAPGGSSWLTVSDRNAKENFAEVDGRSLLEKLSAIPMETWNYKSQEASIRHMGPMAQDFHSAFAVGEDDKHINTVDADGVALAGVQALYRIVREKDEQINQLSEQLRQLQAAVQELKSR